MPWVTMGACRAWTDSQKIGRLLGIPISGFILARFNQRGDGTNSDNYMHIQTTPMLDSRVQRMATW